MNSSARVTPATSIITTTVHHLRQSECAFFYYNNLALIFWATASVCCFLALVSTIHTIYNAYQLWSTIHDLQNLTVELIDDACQILLPLGVCKQICHPHHIGTVNANYVPKGHKDEPKQGKRENRYPEDVTFPPSDIEKVYDVMGDEDAAKSKMFASTMRLPVQEPQPQSNPSNAAISTTKKSPNAKKALSKGNLLRETPENSRNGSERPKKSLGSGRNTASSTTTATPTVKTAISREQVQKSGRGGGGGSGKNVSRRDVSREQTKSTPTHRTPRKVQIPVESPNSHMGKPSGEGL